MMTHLMFISLVVFCCLPALEVCAHDLDRALQRLEDFRPADGRQILDECIDTIRRELDPGDMELWGRIKRILDNPLVPRRVKVEVFRVAIDKADARIATDMLSLALRWIDELAPVADIVHQVQRHGKHDEVTATRIALLSQFIPRLGQEPCRGWIGAKQQSVLLLEQAMLKTGGPGLGSDAWRVFAASPAPIEYRRAAAETIIAAQPGVGWPSSVLAGVLDASSFPKLRKLVRASSDPKTFHYGAAGALAYQGDLEILPDLEALRPAFKAHSVNAEGFLIGSIWRINIQHPPSKLLEYISSTESLIITGQHRKWAIRRAVELSLPKPKIRQAILTHISKVKPITKGEWTIHPGVSEIKKLGLDLGVLRPDDLPDVKLPPDLP